MPEATPSTPDAAAARSWVWHATVESRAAGKVSILACAETLVAVVLYWWIAIRWDTHWHLLSSVFIAPLLLLRSPESMKLGVRWFLKDWFGFMGYETWPKARRRLWISAVAIVAGIATYAFTHWLCGLWLVGQTGWGLWAWSALIGALSMVFAIAIAGAFAFAGAGADKFSGAGEFAGKFAFAAAFAAAFAGIGWVVVAFSVAAVVALALSFAGVGVGVGTFLSVGLLVGMGVGVSLRSLAFRVAATLWHWSQGLRRLPENWQESNFWVDSCVPAELMPGIRDENGALAFDGFIRSFRNQKKLILRWLGLPLFSIIFFLPAFLYRLNIKATCWFWWPLAYLLKPVPQADKESAQKQALCWPLDDPLQLLLILGPLAAAVALLGAEYLDFSVWRQFKNSDAVPIQLKVVLGVRWGDLPLWHWAMIVAQLCGLRMLWIASHARSHKANDNWDVFAREGMPGQLRQMNWLMKLRQLMAAVLIILGLGMCLISFPEWRRHLPGPLLQRMERFYHTQEKPAPASAPAPAVKPPSP